MSAHNAHATIEVQPSPAQHATLTLMADTGLIFGGHIGDLMQDPYSMALIGEVYDTHPSRPRWERPIFTVITASGDCYCPYS